MKLKQQILALFMLLTCSVSADDINFFDYSVGVNYQYLKVKPFSELDVASESDGFGHAIGFYYKGELYEYLHFATGIDYVSVEDDSPFTQTVKNELTGEISIKTSKVTGFAAYVEGGFMYKPNFQPRFSTGILAGYRHNSLDRSIFQCDECPTEELADFDSSMYGKVFVEYQLTENVHIQINYSHFLAETGFDNSIGVHVSFLAL